MTLLEQKEYVKQQLVKSFDYTNGKIPYGFEDCTDTNWQIENDVVAYWLEHDGNIYPEEYFNDNIVDNHIYRGDNYTMILVNTLCGRNFYVAIFDNKREELNGK